jgi:hypothetical protein
MGPAKQKNYWTFGQLSYGLVKFVLSQIQFFSFFKTVVCVLVSVISHIEKI